jgi:hypothetical protein
MARDLPKRAFYKKVLTREKKGNQKNNTSNCSYNNIQTIPWCKTFIKSTLDPIDKSATIKSEIDA